MSRIQLEDSMLDIAMKMSADQMRTIDLTEEEWIDIDSQVCERLEHFQKP